MASKDVVVKVDDVAYDVGASLVKFVVAAKGALADGWQPGSDLPVILSSAIADLAPVLGKVGSLPAEFEADKVGFVKGINVALFDLVDVLLKK